MVAWDTFVEFSDTDTITLTVAEVRGGTITYLGAEMTFKTIGRGDIMMQILKRERVVFDTSLGTLGPYMKQPLRMEKRNVGPDIISAGDTIRIKLPEGTKASGWLYILIKET